MSTNQTKTSLEKMQDALTEYTRKMHLLKDEDYSVQKIHTARNTVIQEILASQWTSVEDGLPENPKDGDEILLKSANRRYPEANRYYEDDQRWCPGMTKNDRIPAFYTHWMRIPPITPPGE